MMTRLVPIGNAAVVLTVAVACTAPAQPSAPTQSATRPTAPAAPASSPATASSPAAPSASPSPATRPAGVPSPSAPTAAPGRWTFDGDAAGSLPNGAQAFTGQWAVRAESDAPSQPN